MSCSGLSREEGPGFLEGVLTRGVREGTSKAETHLSRVRPHRRAPILATKKLCAFTLPLHFSLYIASTFPRPSIFLHQSSSRFPILPPSLPPSPSDKHLKIYVRRVALQFPLAWYRRSGLNSEARRGGRDKGGRKQNANKHKQMQTNVDKCKQTQRRKCKQTQVNASKR